MKNIFFVICFLVSVLHSTGQSSVSGVINRYYKVTKVDRNIGWVKLATMDAFLPAYKKALLVQMKGATMTSSNNSSFGDIASVNNAGNFELVNLCGFIQDTVFFERKLNNYFTDGEPIQLVAIPEYTNVTISDTLKGTAWDATTGLGGIIAIEASDTVILDKPIDASGIGFVGGTLDTYPDCTFILSVTDYCMGYNTGTINAIQGAKKGEGIAPYITNKEYGRGKQVNGGGGGNNHNAGGGGGSNYGAGGLGGNRTVGGCKSTASGVGGLALKSIYDTCSTRLFLGGGGGSGHGNQNTSFGNTGKPGGSGGGLVIITAKVIKANGTGEILANGERPYSTNTLVNYGNVHDADSDGGGGGGAGGSILLNCTDFVGNTTVSAKGAKGSNAGIGMISNFCDGPGGGGGGGVIVFSTATTPAGVTTDISAGPSGLVVDVNAPACYNTGNGATNGVDGNVLFNYARPAPRDSTPLCLQIVLVDKLLSFAGQLSNNNILLTAKVADRNTVQQMVLQRSFNGMDFEELLKVNNNGREEYILQDAFQYRTVWYRVLITDRNGRRYYSAVLRFTGKLPLNQVYVNIYPNPVHNTPVFFFNSTRTQKVNYTLYDATGKKVWSNKLLINSGENNYTVNLPNLAGGVYYVQFTGEGFSTTKQFIKLP